MIDQKINV